jgi:hypothetical protein
MKAAHYPNTFSKADQFTLNAVAYLYLLKSITNKAGEYGKILGLMSGGHAAMQKPFARHGLSVSIHAGWRNTQPYISPFNTRNIASSYPHSEHLYNTSPGEVIFQIKSFYLVILLRIQLLSRNCFCHVPEKYS